jgi:hypothetical protein
MQTSTFPSRPIGWTAILAGAMALAGFASALIFTFAGEVGAFFYELSDLSNVSVAVLGSALAWMLYARFRGRLTVVHKILLVVTLVGALFAIYGYKLLLFEETGWVLSGWYTNVGHAMIGLWVISFNYAAWRHGLLPKALSGLGIVAGLMVALGFVAVVGLMRQADYVEVMSLLQTNIWQLSILGLGIVTPIWCIWLGGFMLSKAGSEAAQASA